MALEYWLRRVAFMPAQLCTAHGGREASLTRILRVHARKKLRNYSRGLLWFSSVVFWIYFPPWHSRLCCVAGEKGLRPSALLLHSRHLAPAAKHQNNKFQFPPGDFHSIYELQKNAFACALICSVRVSVICFPVTEMKTYSDCVFLPKYFVAEALAKCPFGD